MEQPMNPSNPTTDAKLTADLHAALRQFDIYPADSPEGPQPKVKMSEVRRGLKFTGDDTVQVASLVKDDSGVLRWTPGPVPYAAAGPRRRAGLTTLFGGTPVTTVKFETLGVNQVLEKLEEMDQTFTPNGPGKLREVQNGKIGAEAAPVQNGKILLFIHGTFSNNDALITELAQSNPDGPRFLADAARAGNYNQILAFDHYTVSRSPVLNALDLSRLFAPSDASVDIVCHSRGGLVTRWFCEVLDRKPQRPRRAVLVGCPIGGTALAAPDKLRNAIDLFTNVGSLIGDAASLVPFLSAAGALIKLGFSVVSAANKLPLIDGAIAMIPGLAAQSRVLNTGEINALKAAPLQATQYFAITSQFRPPDIGWKFWRAFCDWTQPAAFATDLIFPQANDLVVDTAAMTESVNPAQTQSFGDDRHIYHTIYFRQPETVGFLRGAFGLATAAGAP
jgi:hypothetical protein